MDMAGGYRCAQNRHRLDVTDWVLLQLSECGNDQVKVKPPILLSKTMTLTMTQTEMLLMMIVTYLRAILQRLVEWR